MVRSIGIDPFTVPSLEPVQFVRAAAAAGFTHVSLRTIQPQVGSNPGAPIADERNLDELRDVLAATGIAVAAVDIIDISADADFSAIDRGLRVAAALGSASVSIIAKSGDLASVAEGLSRLCALALPLGISPRLEPISYLPVGDLDVAIELVEQHPGAGLMIDSLHMHRLGVSPERVREIAARLPVTFQINGVSTVEDLRAAHRTSGSTEPDVRRWEAIDGRLLPGEGENDLAALAAAVPEHVVALVEAPNSRAVAEAGPVDYLRAAHAGAVSALAIPPAPGPTGHTLEEE